jgi:hypothetical protein
MRIRSHISLLLLVAISGALLLAGTVGSLLWMLERQSERSGLASADFQRVEALARCSHDLLASVSDHEGGAEHLPALPVLVERCRADLAALHVSDVVGNMPLLGALAASFEDLARQGLRLVQTDAAPAVARDRTAYRTAVEAYSRTLEELLDAASARAHQEERGVTARRRWSLWIMCAMSAVYLIIVLVMRAWILRQLVRPIERLTHEVEEAAADPRKLFGLGGRP